MTAEGGPLGGFDCSFLVSGREFPAHKALLRRTSPVFEKMFFGDLAQDRVVITDISPLDFEKTLHFLYSREIDISSTVQAWGLYYVASKYLLQGFARALVGYIEKNFTMSNLPMNYEYSDLFGVSDLKARCMREMAHYVRGVLHPACDYHVKPATLEEILRQKSLQIDDLELRRGVVEWAVVELSIGGVPPTSLSVLTLLNSMNVKCAEMTAVNTWQCCAMRHLYKADTRVTVTPRTSLTAVIRVDRSVLLYGLAVLTEDRVKLDSEFYNCRVCVEVSCGGRSSKTAVTCFAPYDSFTYVSLSELVLLECDSWCSVRVSWVNLDSEGSGTVLLYHMDAVLWDEEKRTRFVFEGAGSGVVKGLCFYPV